MLQTMAEPDTPSARSASRILEGLETSINPWSPHLKNPDLIGRTKAGFLAARRMRKWWCRSPSK